MLRLRNGDGLTEEPGAMSSLRFIQGIDLTTVGSCCFQGWDSCVMHHWWFFSSNDCVSGCLLAAQNKIPGEKHRPLRVYSFPKKWLVGVVWIQVLPECLVLQSCCWMWSYKYCSKTQCEINHACKQIGELYSMSELNRRSCSCVRGWFRSL